jgi:hypothetical protein
MLVKYKSDLTRPFDEATTFLNKIETQLSHLCTGASVPNASGLFFFFLFFSLYLLVVVNFWNSVFVDNCAILISAITV